MNKFKLLYWRFFNKEKYKNYLILKWIKKAKQYLIKDNSKLTGLCRAFNKTLPNKLKKAFYTPYIINNYDLINRLIPEFNPMFFNVSVELTYGFWWDSNDKISRINALNKLIRVYENKLK